MQFGKSVVHGEGILANPGSIFRLLVVEKNILQGESEANSNHLCLLFQAAVSCRFATNSEKVEFSLETLEFKGTCKNIRPIYIYIYTGDYCRLPVGDSPRLS